MPLSHANTECNGFELDPDLHATSAVVQQGIDLWQTKRGGRFAPSREAFSLRDTRAIAPHLQFIELIDEGPGYRQRLTGTAIVTQLKEDPTGKVYAYPSDDPVVQRMQHAIAWVVENRKPLRTFAPRTALSGQEFFSHETAFLPLSNDGRTIDMLALVSAFKSGATRA
jgi:hypothetical protein